MSRGRHKCVVFVAVAGVMFSAGVAAKPHQGQRGRPASASHACWSLGAINLLQPAPAAAPRPLAVLSGGGLAFVIAGEGGEQAVWQFGYEDVVVAQGRVQLGNDGIGLLKLLVPRLRVRAACRLMVILTQRRHSIDVVVYPESGLGASAKLVNSMRLGVIDHRGLVQQALAAEGVQAEDITAPLARAAFKGSAVIIAGIATPPELEATCRSLDSRLRAGLSVVVINPPLGWRRWDISPQKLAAPVCGNVVAAKGIGQAVEVRDLDGVHWATKLRAGKHAAGLMWVVPSQPSSQSNETRDRPGANMLIVARSVDRGQVIVANLPQLQDPLREALGRRLLDEMILWLLRSSPPAGKSDPERSEQ